MDAPAGRFFSAKLSCRPSFFDEVMLLVEVSQLNCVAGRVFSMKCSSWSSFPAKEPSEQDFGMINFYSFFFFNCI